MDQAKHKRLEEAGWSVGTAEEFLELSQEEAVLVEMKLVLSRQLRKFRQGWQVSQSALAQKIGSSQSRVAKMEAGDPSVSTDLLIGGLLATGATPEDIARAISSVGHPLQNCSDKELLATR